MNEDLRQVEASGETVGEAKWAALRELEKLHPDLDKAAVQFQVVSEGERGLLGVGYAPARVVASIDQDAISVGEPAVADSDLAGQVRDLVERITAGIGVRCRIEIEEGDEELTATCSGSNLGLADRQARADDRRDPVPRERDRLALPARRPEGRRR